MRPRRRPKLRLRRVRLRLRLPLRFRRPRLPRIPFRESLTKLPNVLTYVRIGMIPFVVWALDRAGTEAGGEEMRTWSMVATVGFAAASITDFIDGWLARRRDQSTLVGRFLDPVADKLLVAAVLIELTALRWLPAWLTILLVARELFITVLRAVASHEGFEVQVIPIGKLKTACQMLGLGGVMLHFERTLPWVEIGVPFHDVGYVLLLAGLALSLASAVLYVRGFIREVVRQERTGG